MESGSPIQKPKSRGARVLGWMGEHVAGTVLGFAVTAALTAGVVWVTGKDKTEGQRIDQVREEIVDGGLEIRHFQEVSLHAGATSYLLTVGKPGQLEPDEIRIYDAEGSSLKRRLSFDPEIRSQDEDVVVQPDTFEVLSVHDVDADGQPELIGSYKLESAITFLEVPITIVWDPTQHQYLLRPLLVENPRPQPGEDAAAREDLEPYESAFTFTTAEGESFEAWATESVAPLETPLYFAREEPLYLGGSYPFPTQEFGQAVAGKKLQIAFWAIAIDPPEASPKATRLCLDDDVRLIEAEVGRGEREEDAISRTWDDLVRSDELARRGEADGDATYIGFVIDEDCVLGE
jgi:hypothetical protein